MVEHRTGRPPPPRFTPDESSRFTLQCATNFAPTDENNFAVQMQLETLAFTASTHLAAATTTKTTSSPSPRLPPPPLATKRARQNLGATNRSSANLAVASPRARKPVERRETDPHARMPYVSPRRLKAMLKDDGTARIHDTFRSFDWNGSGSIDRKELKEVLQELRLPCDGARVRAALRKYDEDGSGVLEKDELVKLVFELREAFNL